MKSQMNSKKMNKNNNDNKNEKLNSYEEKIENVSYFQLFRYANKKEKLMIFIGIISSLIQGCTLPFTINAMGYLTDAIISLVINVKMKSITGINNDDTLEELFNLFISNKSNITESNFDSFSQKYPDVNLQNIMSNLKQSEYGSYDFNSYNDDFKYKTNDTIFHDIYKYLALFAIIGVIAFIASFMYYACLDISSTRQTTMIRSLVFKSLMKQEIEWHEKTSPGELSSRIISDSLLIQDGIGIKIGILLQNITTFVVCFIIAFFNGWKLTLYLSVIFPILFIIVTVMGIIIGKYTKKSQDAYGVLGGITQEAFSQIRTIVSFGNEQKEIDRYIEKLKPTRKYDTIKDQAFGISLGLIFCVVYSSYGLAFLKGSQFIHDGTMIGGDVLKVFMGVSMGAMSISGCGNIMSSFGKAVGAASKLFHIIERKPKIDCEAGECRDQEFHGDIEFRNVHFTYPSRPDVEILKGISFKCQRGQTVALVGASGSGKSTIIQLLERYYLKSEGDILIDGKPIEDYNIHWLRQQIGIVSQEPTLFDTTIGENISICCPGATQKQIESAAKLAYAHDFISKLPNGYQTSIGERGLQLSGGQKQRICIARALMMNPKILLLDEATSALDNQSEKVVQYALDSASSGRSTLVVAHRLTTVKDADCILVMDKGIIVESGTHKELMDKEGVYYNLVKNQQMNTSNSNHDSSDEEVDLSDLTIGTEESSNDSSLQKSQPLEKNITTLSEQTLNHRSTTVTSFKSMTRSTKEDSKKSRIPVIDWKRYFNYNKPVWFNNLLGCLGAAFNGCIQPAFGYILGSAMNVFNERGDKLLDDGKFWGWMFVVLGVANFFSFYSYYGGFSTAAEYITYVFRKEMYSSVIRQEVGFFDCNDIGSSNEFTGDESASSSGTLTAILATEAGLVQGLNSNIGFILEITITIIAGFGIAFINGWKLALILLVITPFLLIGTFLEMRADMDNNKDRRNALENSSKVVVEAVSSIKTVYALNLESYFCELYDEKLQEPEKRLERKQILSSIGSGFSNSIINFAYIIGVFFGTIFIKNGELEFKNMFRVLMAIIFTAMGIGRTTSLIQDYNKAVDAFNHIIKIIDRKSKIDASNPKGIKNVSFDGNISFNNLRFRYPSRPNVTVLRLGEDKIEVPAGKMLALVGGSGCGKSTLIGILPRWYDAQHGEVLVDGQKNTDYNIKWLRQHIGIVNQEPCLFNISIKENILYGKEDATDEEVYEAAKKANIHDFIKSLPEGYDTLVGGLGTSQMSGGQKQRIAIARAMIRNPKVLLLDEATSALDAESELIVQQALEEASQGRTTITIGHRLSTIKNADIIVVMKEGRIVERGNHEELMNKKGEYYEMVLAGDGGVHKNE